MTPDVSERINKDMHRSDSNQDTDYIANGYFIFSSWISGFLWHKFKNLKYTIRKETVFDKPQIKFLNLWYE